MNRFWKPRNTDLNLVLDDSGAHRNTEDSTTTLIFPPRLADPLDLQRQLLPIFKYRRQILYSVEHFSLVIICGETGSGKSTQIPQYLVCVYYRFNVFLFLCFFFLYKGKLNILYNLFNSFLFYIYSIIKSMKMVGVMKVSPFALLNQDVLLHRSGKITGIIYILYRMKKLISIHALTVVCSLINITDISRSRIARDGM